MITLRDLQLLLNGDEKTVEMYEEYLKLLCRECSLCGKEFVLNSVTTEKFCESCRETGKTIIPKIRLCDDPNYRRYKNEYQRWYYHLKRLKDDDREKAVEALKQFAAYYRATGIVGNLPKRYRGSENGTVENG